jgi:alpha,alpha-trehalase
MARAADLRDTRRFTRACAALTTMYLLTSGCGAPRSASKAAVASEVPVPARPAATVNGAHELALPRSDAQRLLCRLFAELDRDCDRKITILDEKASTGARGHEPSWPFTVETGSAEIRLDAPHEAAQLAGELILGLRGPDANRLVLDLDRVHADPASHLAYRISARYWDALTRRIDADTSSLSRAATDEKLAAASVDTVETCPELAAHCPKAVEGTRRERLTRGRELYVYYPGSDPAARAVFERASDPGRLRVLELPREIDDAWLRELTSSGRHGLLTLALDASGRGRPFVVPGGRFNELYGWDTYFMVRGLIDDASHLELAKSTLENQAYEIERYGKILNANRTYYLTRSQPPFFAASLLEVLRRIRDPEERRSFLARMLPAALREYTSVWTAPPRRLALCDGDACLARYFGEGRGEPPEVEPGHFAWFYQAHAVSHGHCARPGNDEASRERFLLCVSELSRRFRAGELADADIERFFRDDACMRESGHDTTFRFYDGRERCTEFASVDLNSLLFKYELDLAELLADPAAPRALVSSAPDLCARARRRAGLVQRYFWDARRGLFFDYDAVTGRRSQYVAATALYPLWASAPNICGASLVTPDMASAVRTAALAELEAPGGLMATAPTSLARVKRPVVLVRNPSGAFETRKLERQWEAPNGWAPHQILAVDGLRNAGFASDADRLTYRWLYTIVANSAAYHGTVPEKFDVVARSHAVFEEYGNVGVDFSYIAEEGFGWMNASFVLGWRSLSPALRAALGKLVPPEQLFPAE